jgi:acetyl-CoA carboxylase carboxyl transferase subunit alpha
LVYIKQELLKKDPETLLEERTAKFRKIGAIDESGAVDPHIKRNMKKRDALHEDDELRMLPSGNGSAPKLLIATGEGSRE